MNQRNNESGPFMHTPAVYRIRVRGRVNGDCADRLEGMNITWDEHKGSGEQSILVGRLSDQAALSGVLSTLYEMHRPLVSVECLEAG